MGKSGGRVRWLEVGKYTSWLRAWKQSQRTQIELQVSTVYTVSNFQHINNLSCVCECVCGVAVCCAGMCWNVGKRHHGFSHSGRCVRVHVELPRLLYVYRIMFPFHHGTKRRQTNADRGIQARYFCTDTHTLTEHTVVNKLRQTRWLAMCIKYYVVFICAAFKWMCILVWFSPLPPRSPLCFAVGPCPRTAPAAARLFEANGQYDKRHFLPFLCRAHRSPPKIIVSIHMGELKLSEAFGWNTKKNGTFWNCLVRTALAGAPHLGYFILNSSALGWCRCCCWWSGWYA